MLALQRANEIRLKRIALKRQIKAAKTMPGGCRVLADALEEMPDWLEREPVWRLLRTIPYINKTRLGTWVRNLERHRVVISETKTCGQLTARERQILIKELRKRYREEGKKE